MTRLSSLLRVCSLTAAVLLGLLCAGQSARAQAPIPYGEAISLEQAKKVIAAAEVEAKKNNWPVAIAIVDGSGFLVAFHRLDNTQLGSVKVAMQKAETSAKFRRPTKVFEEMLEKGGANLKILKLPHSTGDECPTPGNSTFQL